MTRRPAQYVNRVDEFLLAPGERLDLFQASGLQRQYGAFVLAEYFEHVFGSEFMRTTWEHIVMTNVVDDIGAALVTEASSWDRELPKFWRAVYLLTESESNPNYIDARTDRWRLQLETKSSLDGTPGAVAESLGLDESRPLRTTRFLSANQIEEGANRPAGGGAAFIELIPSEIVPGGTLDFAIDADDELNVEVLTFSSYPDGICDSETLALSAISGGFSGAASVAISDTCRYAAVIATNADPQADPVLFNWRAVYETPAVVIANFGFETGTLDGWTTFSNDDGIPNDPIFGISSTDPHNGTYAATIETSGDHPAPAGFAQEISVQPGEQYFSALWVNGSSAGGAILGIEVLNPDGTVLAQQTITGFGSEWRRLSLLFTPTTPTVTLRATLIGFFGEDAEAAFDDFVVVRSVDAALINVNFDDGPTLPGWSTFGELHGTVDLVSDGTPTGYAVQLESITGEPVGVEQTFDAYSSYQVYVSVNILNSTTVPILIEAIRPDGSVAASNTTIVNASENPRRANASWDYEEGIVTLRISVVGAPNVVVQIDNVTVSYDT